MTRARRLAWVVALAATVWYAALGWELGADAFDNDTLSLILTWKLYRAGALLDGWPLSTPKFLPIALDGCLYEFGGFGWVWARALLAGGALATASFLLAFRLGGLGAAVAAAGLLLANSVVTTLVLQGNSTVLLSALALWAVYAYLEARDRVCLLLLFAAALARSEGLAFLLVFVAATAWLGPRSRALRRVAFGLALVLAAAALDCYFPTRLSGHFLTTAEITAASGRADLRRLAALEAAGADPGYYLEQHRRAQDSYLSNFWALSSRLLRPWIVYLALAAAGMWTLRRRRRELIVIATLAALPAIYCGALHARSIWLADRFLLPMVPALAVLTAVAIRSAMNRSRLQTAGSLAVLIALLAVAGRDLWFARGGYLQDTAASRADFQAGLERLPDRRLRIVASQQQWPNAHLLLDTDINHSIEQQDWGGELEPYDAFLLDVGTKPPGREVFSSERFRFGVRPGSLHQPTFGR